MPIGNQETGLLRDIKNTLNHRGVAVGYQQLTVNGTAAKLTIPDVSVTSAIIIIESSTTAPTIAIRYREDGVLPTASVGMPRSTGDLIEIETGENISRFSIIEAVGATTVANITYYR